MSSRYLVSRAWEYCAGEGPHGTVGVPSDLLDEKGQLFTLGVWPQAPLEVLARNEDDALDQAVNRFNQERVMFRHKKLSKERFDELMATPRVGYPQFTQVIARWAYKEADAPADAPWYYGGADNFSPPAPAPEAAAAPTST